MSGLPAGERPQSLAEALGRAIALLHARDLDAAERLCDAILETHADHFDALHLRAVIAGQRGRYEQADQLLTRALRINPNSADALANRANVQNALGRFDQALAAGDRALALNPRSVEALYHRALALHRLGRFEEALASYERALAGRPRFVSALVNRGAALQDLGRYNEAVATFDEALAIQPRNAEAHYNRGLALQRLDRYAEALGSYDNALAIRPNFAAALNNRGFVLHRLRRYEDALPFYDKALAAAPDFVEALFNRGAALSALGRHEQSSRDVDRALQLSPALPYARGTLLHSKMHCCDWTTFDQDAPRIIAEVRAGKRSAEPATILNFSDSLADQLECARIWTSDRVPPRHEPSWQASYHHDRIRVAYLSSDFREHATAYLSVGLFERHDRTRFETIAVSFGAADRDAMSARLRAAFDQFLDVRAYSDREVTQLLRGMEVDIAVDLKGFTDDARTEIFARRAAPIQVNYLGYPGTMGAEYIDYIIADRVVLPAEHRAFYAEKVVWLPDCYQVNDSSRRIAERTPTRAEVGLPEHAFVFCSFNNNYKITPAMFDVWMRLLDQVERGVLWLFEGHPAVPANLRREAVARGIASERLVFAPRLPVDQHLARHRLADLFLDTLPCNAHTTASDALWAGLPVLTCLGSTFAGRVAASLLHAVGLPELVTTTLAQYEARAVELANDTDLLQETTRKLLRNREPFPLFDTDRFRRHIEAAYIEMYERCRREETPSQFEVTP